LDYLFLGNSWIISSSAQYVKMDAEKSTYAGLTQENGFGAA
jgi:hypothetical protein